MSSNFKSEIERRRFLKILSGATVFGLTGWSSCDGGNIVTQDDDLISTPSATEGPFYPIPSIEQQMFNDTDLTRKLPTDNIAVGQVVKLNGTVKNIAGAPLDGSVVELWQASVEGRYNHPSDAADNPNLDQDFQFWGRALTGPDGKYEFKTLIPGEYPGRTGRHLHFRVESPGYRRLSTQSYFAQYSDRNAQDGLYQNLSQNAKNHLTVEFNAPVSDQPMEGTFDMVLVAS